MIDLHRHDEYSTFDGFGKPEELAVIAKELGYTSLGISNHGNTNGLVKHFYACKDVGIKPVMGCEGYFLPKKVEGKRGYHLCLFAKDNEGYRNLNTLQYEGEKIKHYNAIWTFELLEKYSKGLICTSACIAGYLAQCIQEDRLKQARKYIAKMVDIFGDDFYIEVQPYKISQQGLQEKVNLQSIKLAKELGVKLILTSDSHRGRKEDLSTYMKMHEIAGHDFMDIESTYKERYMPTESELKKRFIKMHKNDFDKTELIKLANEMIANLEELEDKVDDTILDNLEQRLPRLSKDSRAMLKKKSILGLKRKGKTSKKYKERLKEELEVIHYHGFEDYFLMVADYTNWAKEQGIAVGPGRGSGCNCLVNYALNITSVDPILFDLDFSRFLRFDKKKMPDIDLDFETARRGEVIEYLLNKYPDKAAQICSYGLYKVDNLINDLAKCCDGLVDQPNEIKSIKKLIKSFEEEGMLNINELLSSAEAKMYNREYDDIILHFSKLYNKVRYIGTHAAGVAITAGNMLDYTALRIDKKTGKHFTSYDLSDMEKINVIKFDILGLTTMSGLLEMRAMTGKSFSEDMITDEKILNSFKEGNCDGIFQFEKKSVQKMLGLIDCDSFEDVIAASAMNRPGPLSLKMPDVYAASKQDASLIENDKPYSCYLEKTHGCVIYQEQVQAIAVNIGGLEWPEADKIIKMQRGGTDKAIKAFEENYNNYLKKFVKGAKRFGMTKDQSFDIFDKFFNYAFNKGHSTGYSLISLEEMFFKVYYPAEFWSVKLKYASDDAKAALYKEDAVKDGILVFLPHVNYSADSMLRKVDGEKAVQEGLSSIKGIGEKAAKFIEEERQRNGVFINFDDFYDRCKGRAITSRTIDILKEQGALEFNKSKYIKRVTKYNSALYMRAQQN